MIYIISGISGSGKTTISKELSKRLKQSFYIQVDTLRNFVISGYSSPQEWNKETEKQFELATLNTIDLAKNADKYGFDVVIDDVVFFEQEKIYLKELPESKKIWICPNLETIQKRNLKREKNIPEELITKLHTHLSQRENSKDWIKIDTTNLSIEETVEEILRISRK